MRNWSSGGLAIDVYDDIFLEDISGMNITEKLASTQMLTQAELDQLPDDKFALVVLASPNKIRKYPIHDEGHIILAREFLEKNAGKLTPYMQKTAAYFISRACKLYEVDCTEGIAKLAEERHTNYVDSELPEVPEVSPWRSINIQTLPDSDFAFTKTSGSKTYRYYPMDTKTNFISGVNHFNEQCSNFLPVERVKIASAMYQREKELDVEVDMSVIHKYATAQPNPNFNLYMNLRQEALSTDNESKEALKGLIEKRANFKGQSFGRALEVFDEQTGLNNMWEVTFPDPYSSCYAIDADVIDAFGSEKRASTDEDKIMKLASDTDKLASVFSPSMVTEFRKDPVSIFNSLPAPTKQLLLSM